MLQTKVTRRKLQGKRYFTAEIGEFLGQGDTRAEAEAELLERIQGDAFPLILSTSDGAVWILHAVGGIWWYRICRPTAGGNVEGGSAGAWSMRQTGVDAMIAHMNQYEQGLGPAVGGAA